MKQATEKLQKGSLRPLPLTNGRWSWEWRYIDPVTGAPRSKSFSGVQYPSQSEIEKHLEPFIERLNSAKQEQKQKVIVDPTFGDLLDKFISDEKLVEIKERRAGERSPEGDLLAWSTASSYLSNCKLLREKWGTTKLDRFKPLEFQNWLKELKRSAKTKGHIKAFVNRLFNKAKLFEMVWFLENPIKNVEVRGISKRSRKPAVLTFEQFWLIFDLLKEPYNIMSLVDISTGLRVSELLALNWAAISFDRLCMKIEEGVVHGRIGRVKTEYSKDELPFDPDAATILLEWKRKSKGTGLVFPSPITGHSYDASPIQQDWIRRAGFCLVACPECGAVPGVACTIEHRGRGKKFNIPVHDTRRELATESGFGSIGWHTFRHTYRTFLGELKAPLEVQKALMRQADISTTLKYGQSSMGNQRTANRMVVREILIRRSLK